jgi:hypothetical protein
VSKRCLSSTFFPVFLTNSYLLSNLLSSDAFIESSDKILLELQPFDFFSAEDMVALKCVMPNHYFCYFSSFISHYFMFCIPFDL